MKHRALTSLSLKAKGRTYVDTQEAENIVKREHREKSPAQAHLSPLNFLQLHSLEGLFFSPGYHGRSVEPSHPRRIDALERGCEPHRINMAADLRVTK